MTLYEKIKNKSPEELAELFAAREIALTDIIFKQVERILLEKRGIRIDFTKHFKPDLLATKKETLDWMTDEAVREKPSGASDYGFVTAEQAAENIAKAAAAAFGNKAEEEKPVETEGQEFDAMARAKKTADSFLRKAVDTHVIIPHSYAVMRDDGVIYCGSCDDPLHCDENGDMPYICPSCGNIIDYSDIVRDSMKEPEKTPQDKSHGKTFIYNGGWKRKEAPNNES